MLLLCVCVFGLESPIAINEVFEILPVAANKWFTPTWLQFRSCQFAIQKKSGTAHEEVETRRTRGAGNWAEKNDDEDDKGLGG